MSEMIIKQNKDGQVTQKTLVTSEEQKQKVTQEMEKTKKEDEQVKTLKRV